MDTTHTATYSRKDLLTSQNTVSRTLAAFNELLAPVLTAKDKE